MGKVTGLTVIELMITMAVAALVLGFAIPAFNGLINQNQMTSQVNSLVLAINYARSEAAKTGGVVSVQAVDDSDTSNEWGPGFCVVPGNPGNCTGNDVLRRFSPSGDITFNGTSAFDGLGTLSFNSRGMMIGGAAGDLQVCGPDKRSDPGRELTVNLVGRTATEDLICH